MKDIKEYLLKEKKRINERIALHIDNQKKELKHVSSSTNDTFERLKVFAQGGKGIRGGLFMAAAQMFGYKDNKILLNIAATLEILHASLLIHDDIMDNDEIRRGNTSIYAQYIPVGKSIGANKPVNFGKSMGICIGDIGFFIALNIFQATIKNIHIPNRDKLYKILLQELMTVGIGQMDDVRFSAREQMPSINEIISMYTYKTAHYTFSLPFVLAATLTNESKEIIDKVENLGIDIGILFQLKDDEIGLFSTENTIGKPIGSDVRENKKTVLRAFLDKNMNQKEKDELKIIIAKPSFESADIQTVRNVLHKYNVKKYLDELNKKHYSHATSIIRSLPVSQDNKDLLLDLTDYVIERTS